ncbi:ergothioneine biosynthesis protein EgtB [soil metagenome]
MNLSDQYQTIRNHSVALCAPLQKEDYVVQPIVDVSPPKWHLAHCTWFWEEFILAKYQPHYKRFHPRYSFLFNSYYNAVGDRVLRLQRGNMSRPTIDEILDYRLYVDECMMEFLKSIPDEVKELVELGLNHEQQHQELLATDIKYILGHNPLFPAYRADFQETISKDTDHGFVNIEEGLYRIGYAGKGFSFDNEHRQHNVYLNNFSIRKSLVTNGEYLQFMEAGGYHDPQYWHADGWTWVQENRINSALYWHQLDGQWNRYAMSGLEPIDRLEPVTHVSFYEAYAFAEWKKMRLPTEFEWEAASPHLNWGKRWEHTNSAYLPYPGFAKADGAIGEYNGKFMINQMVLRGSSVVTPSGHSRNTYRNFFQPNLRWQFTGIRLCKM